MSEGDGYFYLGGKKYKAKNIKFEFEPINCRCIMQPILDIKKRKCNNCVGKGRFYEDIDSRFFMKCINPSSRHFGLGIGQYLWEKEWCQSY